MAQKGSLVSAEYKMRMCIFDALLSCMNEADINKITVREICTRACISRASFYHYFTDKYEVAKWYAALLAKYGIYEAGRFLTWHEGISKTVQGMRAVDPFFQKMGQSCGDDFLVLYSVESRRANLTETVEKFKEKKVTPALALQIHALALSETHLINAWIMDEHALPTDDFVDALETIVPTELHQLLKTPSPKAAPRPMLNLYPFHVE